MTDEGVKLLTVIQTPDDRFVVGGETYESLEEALEQIRVKQRGMAVADAISSIVDYLDDEREDYEDQPEPRGPHIWQAVLLLMGYRDGLVDALKLK